MLVGILVEAARSKLRQATTASCVPLLKEAPGMQPMWQHLWWQLPFHILHLPPEHEGLQNLMQAVDDHHTLLRGNIILPSRSRSSLTKAVPKPLCKLVFVIKHLQAQCNATKTFNRMCLISQ